MILATYHCPNCHVATSLAYERCTQCHYPISLDAREEFLRTGKFHQVLPIQRDLAKPTVKLNLDEAQTMPVSDPPPPNALVEPRTVILHTFIEIRRVVKQLIAAHQITVWKISAIGHDAWFTGNEGMQWYGGHVNGSDYDERSADQCIIAVTRDYPEIVRFLWQLDSMV